MLWAIACIEVIMDLPCIIFRPVVVRLVEEFASSLIAQVH
jgi:hypothetical protein